MRRALGTLGLVACLVPPGPRGPRRSDPATAPPNAFAPSGAPALYYGGPAEPARPTDPLVEAILHLAVERAAASGRPVPALDARLGRVATELASFIGVGPPPYDATEFALSYYGLVEASPYLLHARAVVGQEDATLAELAARMDRVLLDGQFTRLGVGFGPVVAGTRAVIVALQESALELEAIPRALPHSGRARLRGRVLPPFQAPRLYVTDVTGNVFEPPLIRDGTTGFRAELHCGADGVLKLEIVADERRQNPSVLANFPVYCGTAPPRRIELADAGPAVTDVNRVERELLDLLNRDRRRAGLAPLNWDARAAAIARRHSDDMRDRETVGHWSPSSGAMADRARAGGLASPRLFENVARAYSASEVEDSLMNSPGHRANILQLDATHVGIGAALGMLVGGRRELYVTQLFFRVPPHVDTAAARQASAAALAKVRATRGLTMPRVDPDLEEAAQRHAERLAAGQAKAGTAVDLDAYADRFSQVTTLVVVAGDPAESVPTEALDRTVRYLGIGVAQGRHPQLGEAAFFIVLLLARGR